MHLKIASLLVFLFTPFLFAEDIAPLPVSVPASDAKIRYVGRFTKEEKPRCSWSASMIEIRFNGTDLQAKFRELGKDFWQVIVDGKPTAAIELNIVQTLYPIATGLPNGEHTVQLVKRTEAFVGTTQFLGFQMNEGATLLAIAPPSRKIEVIGDSISCGYGNEGANQNEKFSPQTENAWLAYGAVAARILNADYHCVAWSGRKLWPDNTTPSIYDAILPTDSSAEKWDYSKYIPDVIVINLATNDFAQKDPDESGWTGAYLEFIKRLRGYYPNAHIYCMVGSMLNDIWPPERKTLSQVRRYVQKVVATSSDSKVHYIEVPPQNGERDGLGAGWHPSAKTDKLMGELLAVAIKKDLGW